MQQLEDVHEDDLNWLPYKVPKDKNDLSECRSVDGENKEIYGHNSRRVKAVNRFLVDRLNLPAMNLRAAPSYTSHAVKIYERTLFDPTYHVKAAVKYLYEHLELIPVKDYDLEDAVKMADDDAYEKELERLKGLEGGIDITPAVGRMHRDECTCENRWDGESERCKGNRARLRFKRSDKHHCERPQVIIESY